MAKSLNHLYINILGDENVGKTCLWKTYIKDIFKEDFTPTVCHRYDCLIKVDDKEYCLSLLDTKGAQEYERLRRIFYRNASCFILCYSINNRDTFEAIANRWWPKIRKYTKNTPVVLVGTRLDLCRAANPEECVSIEEAVFLKEQINAYSFVECSAKELNNLQNVFEEAVRAVETKSKLKENKMNKIQKREKIEKDQWSALIASGGRT